LNTREDENRESGDGLASENRRNRDANPSDHGHKEDCEHQKAGEYIEWNSEGFG